MSHYVVENYDSIQREVEEVSCGQTSLLAVSKTFPADLIEILYRERGVRSFAESRLKELQEKSELLPKDIIWHYIGKIQSNKLKKIARIARVIHSVENVETIQTLAELAMRENLDVSYFLEVNISGEASKSGVAPQELDKLLEIAVSCQNRVKCIGFMTMAPFEATADELEEYFGNLHRLLEYKRTEFKLNELTQLSMGMSNDFVIAIKKGSTLVRIGSAIFGNRNYL